MVTLCPLDIAAAITLGDPNATISIDQERRVIDHYRSLTPGTRITWDCPRRGRLNGTVINARSINEVFVKGDHHGPSEWWSLPSWAVNHADTSPGRVWWPERQRVDLHDGATHTVAIGVDGYATCTCGAESAVTDGDGCPHITHAREAQDAPITHAFTRMHDVWLADEAWRPDPGRRAHTAQKLMRIMQDARDRMALHTEAAARTPVTSREAIETFGDAA